MIDAFLLLAFGAGLAVFGPRLLTNSAWPLAAPRLGLLAWLALTASSLVAPVLAGLAIVMPMQNVTGGPAKIITACMTNLTDSYGPVLGAALAVISAVLLLGPPVLLTWTLVSRAWDVAQARRVLRARLRMSEDDRRRGIRVIDSPEPIAYCIPGSGGLIAVTSSAIDLLDDAGLEAVLAHERAHLAARHHLLVAFAGAAHRAFGRLPIFAPLPQWVEHLVELAADDAAARRTTPTVVADSLLRLATARVPGSALAANGTDVVARIDRLLDAPTRLGAVHVGSVLTGSSLLVLAPVVLTLLPILTAAGMHCCTG